MWHNFTSRHGQEKKVLKCLNFILYRIKDNVLESLQGSACGLQPKLIVVIFTSCETTCPSGVLSQEALPYYLHLSRGTIIFTSYQTSTLSVRTFLSLSGFGQADVLFGSVSTITQRSWMSGDPTGPPDILPVRLICRQNQRTTREQLNCIWPQNGN